MLVIGKIIKPQGIKGEIKVSPLYNADSYNKPDFVVIDDIEYAVLSFCARDGFLFVRLDKISDRNGAESLRGKNVLSTKPILKKLPDDQYYIKELLGIILFDQSDQQIGEIINIENFGSADVVTVSTKKGIMRFPFLKSLQIRIDTTKRKAVVDQKKLDEVCVYEN